MALFGGAFDERVALTVAQESGGGGITSWRTSKDFTARTGTSIEKIDNTNYAWFLSSMKSLDPASLPHDHHELIAMIAPRAIIRIQIDHGRCGSFQGDGRSGKYRLRLHRWP
jgi:hypothetical protein